MSGTSEEVCFPALVAVERSAYAFNTLVLRTSFLALSSLRRCIGGNPSGEGETRDGTRPTTPELDQSSTVVISQIDPTPKILFPSYCITVPRYTSGPRSFNSILFKFRVSLFIDRRQYSHLYERNGVANSK